MSRTRANLVTSEWRYRHQADRRLYAADSPRLSAARRRELTAEAEVLLETADYIRSIRARELRGAVVA